MKASETWHFSLCWIYLLVRGLETAKYLQIEAIGNRIEFRFSFASKIMWKNIFETTSCNWIIFILSPTKEAQSSHVKRSLIGLNYSDTNEKIIKYLWKKLEGFFATHCTLFFLLECFKSKCWMLFLSYKNANIKYLTSHYQPPIPKKKLLYA